MPKILITGVAGFMGSHLADSFIERGYEVVGIDNLIGGYEDNVPKEVDFHNLNLTNLQSIKPIFEGVDVVLHAACTAYEGLSVFSPALICENTYQITASTLSVSIHAGVKKFVYLSSMARYGTQDSFPFTEKMQPKPQDPYGISKYASELLIRNLAETHGMEYVILVPHNIIGPRQKYDDPFRNVASIMINRMLQGKQPIIYGDGNQTRCFSFMKDVVNPCVEACESDSALGQVINIGPDEDFVTINELAERISKVMKFNLNPIYMPGRPQEVLHATCSADLARDLLNYRTSTTLDEGLKELITWIRSRGPKKFDYHLPIEFTTQNTPKTWTEKLM
jgi:UDP-glucose 4-epimerase